MDAMNIKNTAKREFNNAIALMAIIPMLGFIYLIAAKMGSLSIFEGEPGYITLILVLLIILGMISGRKILWFMIARIIDMQNELVEKGRMAAISETVLSLSHEIRNPLAIVIGSIDVLVMDGDKDKDVHITWERANTIKKNCDRISQVIDKMSRISKPSYTTVLDNIKMLDLPSCELKDGRKK